MNGRYDIYKLTASGARNALLLEYESFSADLNWSKNSQVTITGTCIGTTPLKMADRVAIVRDTVQLFSGIVTEFNTSCADCANNIKTWEATVDGDAVVLEWRYVFATSNGTAPSSIEVAEDVYDKIPNDNNENNKQSALNRMLYYIRKHAGADAHSTRRLLTVSQEDDNTRGEQGRSAYHIKKLSDVISEIGKSDGLYPHVTTNHSGNRILTVPTVRNRTDALTVSPEFGNVTAWEKDEKYPTFNACWVISGANSEKNNDDTTTETRVWVYAEETESIQKYGRIESVISKSDIKIVPKDPDKPDVIPVTEQEVKTMLETEAKSQLQEAAATEKWKVTMMETDGCRFMVDWELGDKVKCVIDGTAFESVIETISISYAAGVETVTPTIGEVENGIYGDLYKLLNGIDRRLRKEEEK